MGYEYYGAGLALAGNGHAVTATIQSSMISNNTFAPDTTDYDFTATGSFTIASASANNLVRASAADSLPAGSFISACPLLGPLRDNGGPTPTHALLSHSSGIDQGNNIADLPVDQRGAPYTRVSGVRADIGAYEVQKNDIVFNSGFDGCP